jgi:hypothetical protein
MCHMALVQTMVMIVRFESIGSPSRCIKAHHNLTSHMSIRATPRTVTSTTTTSSTPQTPINFKDEFVHSTAALAASHDETVSHILSRLDQLQAKISTQPESNNNNASGQTAPRSSTPAQQRNNINLSGDQSVHARLSSLESIHEDALHRLSSKLDQVERQLSVNKESEGLMTQIAARLHQVEPKLQSHANLSDRVVSLESRLRSHSDLHDRISTLEANARPDPEQERILMRINSKLDILEEQQHNGKKSIGLSSQYETERRYEPTSLSSSFENRRSLDSGARTHLDADMDKQERAKYLQSRIEKLKELRNRYETTDVI